MSIVVPDQLEKFEKDEFFIKLRKSVEICYSNHLEEDESIRQNKLREDYERGSFDIVFTESGINMSLTSNGNGKDSNNNEFTNLKLLNDRIEINCEMVLNGVCVLLVGWISLNTLKGFANIQFNKERAEIETQRLRDQLIEYHNHSSLFHHSSIPPSNIFQTPHQNNNNIPFFDDTDSNSSNLYVQDACQQTVNRTGRPRKDSSSFSAELYLEKFQQIPPYENVRKTKPSSLEMLKKENNETEIKLNNPTQCESGLKHVEMKTFAEEIEVEETDELEDESVIRMARMLVEFSRK